jgi:glycosyltransferase involved in cell wall biosynthesis
MGAQPSPSSVANEAKIVGVVVPTGTNCQFAPLFVPTICSALPDNGRLIVVDNGFSTRYTTELEVLSTDYPFVHLRLVSPLSYAAACNFGIRNCLGANEVLDYLVVSNDDVVASRDAIRLLTSSLMEDEARAIAAPQLRSFDGTPQGSAYADFAWWKFAILAAGGLRVKAVVERRRVLRSAIARLPRMEQHRTYNSVTIVPVVKGAFIAVRGSVWQQLDGFDERFDHYGEENDLCYRARKLGYVNIVEPSALVFHYGRGSSLGDSRGASSRSKLAALQLAEVHGPLISRTTAKALKRLLFNGPEVGRLGPCRQEKD